MQHIITILNRIRNFLHTIPLLKISVHVAQEYLNRGILVYEERRSITLSNTSRVENNGIIFKTDV